MNLRKYNRFYLVMCILFGVVGVVDIHLGEYVIGIMALLMSAFAFILADNYRRE